MKVRLTGFKLGYSTGYMLCELKGIVKVHVERSMLFMFATGMTVGYFCGKLFKSNLNEPPLWKK